MTTSDEACPKRHPAPRVEDVARTAWHRPDPGGPLALMVGGRPGTRPRCIRAMAAVPDPEHPWRLLVSVDGLPARDDDVVVWTSDLRTEGDVVVASMLLWRTRSADPDDMPCIERAPGTGPSSADRSEVTS